MDAAGEKNQVSAEAFAEAIMERDQARREAFDLATRVKSLELDLGHARREAEACRRNWNAASNEAKRLLVRNMTGEKRRKRCRK